MTQLFEAKQAVDQRKHSAGSAINEAFRRFADTAARGVGSKWAFVASILLIVIWAASYSIFRGFPNGFNTWQLVINTLTTIITFLMVFLIQATQNRDGKVIQLKLDELIRAVEGARTRMVDLESLTDEELEHLEREFKRIHEREANKAPHDEHTPPTPAVPR